MKISQTKIKPRISVSKWRGNLPIQPYDEDNKYPQRTLNLANTSGTATVCINIAAKYYAGNGFSNTSFNDLVVNRKRLTAGKLLRHLAKDFARWNGLAIHVNYNMAGQITEANYLPFSFCRLKNPDDLGYVSKIAISNCWGDRMRETDYRFIDVFNPDPQIVQRQIEQAGGIDKYWGQILWLSAEDEAYPLAPYDSVLEDIESEGRTKNFKRKLIATQYVAGGIIVTGKFNTEDERKDFKENIENFQGDDNAANLLHAEQETEKDVVRIEPFKMIENDRIYEYTESSVQENIRTAFGIPSPLIGKDIAGKLGMSQMVADAINIYNMATEGERKTLSEVFKRVFVHWFQKVGTDFEILPLVNSLMPAAAPAQVLPNPSADVPAN